MVLLEARGKKSGFCWIHLHSIKRAWKIGMMLLRAWEGCQARGALELHFSFNVVSANGSYLKVFNLFGKSRDILAVVVFGSKIWKAFL